MKLRWPGLALAFILPALATPLAGQADPILTLDHGTVWLTLKPGQDTQGFIEIHNTGDAPDMLTAANCTIAAATTLVDASGKLLPGLQIAAGQTVTLTSTGPHLLLRAARYPVAKNGILPCAFSFTQSNDLVGYLNAVKTPAP